MTFKILFSNVGYAKGISGSLYDHVRYFHRHFYAGPAIQRQVLAQLKQIIDTETPDLCCFVEMDSGSFQSGGLNQIQELVDEDYSYHDISGKYGENSLMEKLPMHGGNSNGFLSRSEIPFKKLYFKYGTKRLIYRLELDDGAVLYFAHFSLKKKIRVRQFREVQDLLAKEDGEVILMADFNILNGFSELKPLLVNTGLKLLNKEGEHTFTFHRRSETLDLCLSTRNISDCLDLKIIPQPFSDHAALLLEIHR